MTRGVFLAFPLLWTLSLPAAADDPGRDAYMIRMLSCKGTDANMEVYIPRSAGNYCERSLRRHVSKLCDWAAAEFVRDASAQIADWHSIVRIGRICCDAHKT